MNVKDKEKERPSAAARAEAAAWLARLHGPNRTREVEAGFQRWMADDPERAAAFEMLTDVWETSARLRRRPMERVASWERTGVRLSFSRVTMATVAVALLAAIGTLLYLRNDAMVTGIGEQRTLVLDDGTRMYLNTDSRAVVRYDDRLRRVDLQRGEAMFEVAHRPEWPFVVTAGDREIRALGTAFLVRRDPETLAVTLVEGKVTVTPTRDNDARDDGPATVQGKTAVDGAARSPATSVSSSRSAVPGSDEFTLSPGERLTLVSRERPKLDRPPIGNLMAWQRGQVALDDVPLADAIAEMNRYSRVRLVIGDPASVAAIHVSGVFRAGDSANFAEAVARTYRLQLRNRDREIVIGAVDGGAIAAVTDR